MRGRRTLGMVRAPLLLLFWRFWRRPAVPATQGFSEHSGPGTLGPPEFFLLPRHRTQLFRSDRAKAFCRRIDGAEQQPLAPRGHREAVRSRSRVGQDAEP